MFLKHRAGGGQKVSNSVMGGGAFFSLVSVRGGGRFFFAYRFCRTITLPPPPTHPPPPAINNERSLISVFDVREQYIYLDRKVMSFVSPCRFDVMR